MPTGESTCSARDRLSGMLGQVAGLRHLPMVLLGGLFLFVVGLSAARTPLWFDEILTYHVASLGSPIAIVEALLAKAENHPPLDYIVRHFSMAAFGGSELAFRLPSIVAVLIGAVCLYIVVLRRTSALPALVAFSFPFVTFALKYFYEGRPYAILFASMCLALLAWQLVTDKPTVPRLIFLTLSLSLGPHAHYYGVLNYVPIAVGEAWRCWERRQIAWPVIGCFVASFAIVGPLVPFVIHSRDFAPNFWTKLGTSLVPHAYVKILGTALPAAVVALLACTIAIFFFRREPVGVGKDSTIPRHEVAAAVTLSLLPVMTYILAYFVTRAFTDKYVINTVVGISLVVAYLTWQLRAWRPRCALFIGLSVSLLATAIFGYLLRNMPARPYSIAAADLRLIEAARHPVAFPDAHHYLQTHFYLPPHLRDRIYMITDKVLAMKFVGHDTNELVFDRLSPYVRMNIFSLCEFTTRYSQFLVLAARPGWVVPLLLEDHAKVQLLEENPRRGTILSVTIGEPSGC